MMLDLPVNFKIRCAQIEPEIVKDFSKDDAEILRKHNIRGAQIDLAIVKDL